MVRIKVLYRKTIVITAYCLSICLTNLSHASVTLPAACSSLFSFDGAHLNTPHARVVSFQLMAEGKLIVFEDVGSIRDIDPYRIDQHGHFEFAIKGLESEAASYWGFSENTTNGKKRYTQGDVDYLNSKIKKFYKTVNKLRRPPFRFVEQKPKAGSGLFSNRQLVKAHGNGDELIADSGFTRMHDMNFHVISKLIIPPHFHIAAQLKSRILDDFYTFLETNNLITPELDSVMQSILQLRVQDIDLPANVQIALNNSKMMRNEKGMFLFLIAKNKNLVTYVHPQYSPLAYLLKILSQTSLQKEAIRDLVLKFMLQSHNGGFLTKPDLPVDEYSLGEGVYNHYLFVKKISEELSNQNH